MTTITINGQEYQTVQAIADYAISEILEAKCRYDNPKGNRTHRTICRIKRDFAKRAKRMHQEEWAIAQQWKDILMMVELGMVS